MRKLQEAHGEREDLALLIVVQREPHAGRMGFRSIGQPTTLEERLELSRRMVEELQLNLPVAVDGMDDLSRERFSQLPGPAFIICPEGKIIAKFPWADASLIEPLLVPRQTALPPGD